MHRRLRLHHAPVREEWFPYEVLGDYVRAKEHHKRLGKFEQKIELQFIIEVAMFTEKPQLRHYYRLVFKETAVRGLKLTL